MKKYIFILLMFFLTACGKENTFKGKEYLYQTPSGHQISLGFDGTTNRYFGKGVNKYFGTYTLKENEISFGVPSSTMMVGNRRHMADEEKFLNTLTDIQSFELTDDRLTLITKGKEKIILTLKKYTYSKDNKYGK